MIKPKKICGNCDLEACVEITSQHCGRWRTKKPKTLTEFVAPLMLKIYFPAENVVRNGFLTEQESKSLALAIRKFYWERLDKLKYPILGYEKEERDIHNSAIEDAKRSL